MRWHTSKTDIKTRWVINMPVGYETINFVYLSELIDLSVMSSHDNKQIGRVVDLAATTGQVYPKITGIVTKVRGRKEPVYIPWSTVKKTTYKKNISVDSWPASGNGNSKPSENEILLKKSFLDRQLISTSGYKVVRVNDLHLLIDNSTKENPNLWLVHIDIGVKGLLRRLGWLQPFNAAFKWVVSRDIKDKLVPWKHVQPTTTTSVYGSLHIRTDASKLSEIHPADLADILEDLGTDERISLIESLEYPAAASTLQEMPIKLRLQIAEVLEPERLARIVNEMQMDETVDLLDELPPERRNDIFHFLTPEKVTDIKDLSKLSAHRVGRIMNTDFITAKPTHTVREVLRTVRAECEKAELLYYVYIIDDADHLKGIVTLRHLLSAEPDTRISDIMRENVISVTIDTGIKRVSQIFFKYNFEAIPVVDDENRIQGIITLRDTLESVFPEVREESKG